ncbi:hypothetical protein ACTSKR_01740 [Chitinibacteraceae bacterium HSL-7]
MLDVIYRKTDAGAEEIRNSTHALPPKMRRLLILIDGKTPAGDLPLPMEPKELIKQLTQLEWDGLIEKAGQGTVSSAPRAVSAPAPSPLPAGGVLDAKAVAKIRNIFIMSNQSQLYGAADGLIEQLANTTDRAVVDAAISHWLAAMQQRGHDAMAQTYLAQIRSMLK